MAPAANGLHKPPLPPAAGRQGTAPSTAAFGGPPQQHQHAQPPMQPYAPPASHQLQQGAPVGHISAAAAELQACMPQAAGQPPVDAPGGDAAAQLSAVLQEKGRLEGQNRHLLSTLAQKEQELTAVKQRASQLEKAAGPAGAGPGAHRSAFQVGEMQRQLDSARQQLTFREQEVGAGKGAAAASGLAAREQPGGADGLHEELATDQLKCNAGPAGSFRSGSFCNKHLRSRMDHELILPPACHPVRTGGGSEAAVCRPR